MKYKIKLAIAIMITLLIPSAFILKYSHDVKYGDELYRYGMSFDIGLSMFQKYHETVRDVFNDAGVDVDIETTWNLLKELTVRYVRVEYHSPSIEALKTLGFYPFPAFTDESKFLFN
ncbi:MAG: hypothetical protein M2R45_05139 [Verrucomicrobia subdivision 3 bacterium]|nr:hypothetical protein [Limisphaerales bacterium]MCS1417201.1 hypothetical protein [Limisphaerales bacterium]